jgi:hypothetical protein
VLAALKLAVLESLLPTFTFQNGPPSCKLQQNKSIQNKMKLYYEPI